MTPYADPVAQAAYFKRYNAARAEKDKQYRRDHRDHINRLRRPRLRLRYKNDAAYRLKKKEKDKLWASLHPEVGRKARKRFLESRPEYMKEAHQRYRLKYPERIKQRRNQYRKNHPEKAKAWKIAYTKKRCSKVLECVNPKSIVVFVEGVRSKRRMPCYYCGRLISGLKAHIDHIIPLAKGGRHSVENLCAACPKCNMTKSDKMLQDWMRLGQQILAL